MKTYRYPLILTMFAGLTPLVAQLSHFNYKAVTYIAPVAALLLVAALPSGHRVSLRELVLMSALFCYLLAQFSLGIGIGSGGTLIVLVLAVVFKRFFSASFRANEIGFERVIHWVLFIYKFNIAYAYVELMLVLVGYQGEFVRLLTTSDQLPGYKDYNHAHFLQAIGFSDVTGLGGIYMGSQAAGMMAVMSLVTFLHLRPYMRHGRRWLVLAMGAVVFCSNMTSLVMLTAAVFLLVFVFEGDLNRIRYKLILVASMPLITPVIFYKMDNSYEYRSYLEAFMPSIDIFLNNLVEFRVLDLLFGYGAVGHNRYTAMGVSVGSDLGILTLVNQAGLALFAICVSALLYINYRAWGASLGGASGEGLWVGVYFRFYQINVVLINMLFISLLHYTSAIEIGLRELFGMHAGLAMFMGSYWFNRRLYGSDVNVGAGGGELK